MDDVVGADLLVLLAVGRVMLRRAVIAAVVMLAGCAPTMEFLRGFTDSAAPVLHAETVEALEKQGMPPADAKALADAMVDAFGSAMDKAMADIPETDLTPLWTALGGLAAGAFGLSGIARMRKK